MILGLLLSMAAAAIAAVVQHAIAGLVGPRAVWRRSFSDPDLPVAMARRRR